MTSTTIAGYLADTLAAAGVERIWGVTGDSLNGLAYSLDQGNAIRWMHTRHEEAADFAAIAKGAGFFSVRVEESEDVATALKAAFDHPGPAVVDVVTSKHELAMPPSIEIAQAKGFSLFMLRAIMSGRGDEIVELARTNLR